jgi:DNA-binding transcriptional MerR regulator
MSGLYRIGEFAELSGVSAKTLRFYDEIGLLHPASVDPRTGYRLYVSQQLEELAAIIALKDLGLPLAEVRHLIKTPESRATRQETLKQLKGRLEESIQTAERSLQWITSALDDLGATKRAVAIVVKRRPAFLIASSRARLEDCAESEIERFQKELLRELPTQAIADVRGTLWHRCQDSGQVEGEAFVALKHRVPVGSVYELKQLPPATLACAYSALDDVSSEETYEAIRNWLKVRGYKLAGPKREVYLDQLLEIQFPFTSA